MRKINKDFAAIPAKLLAPATLTLIEDSLIKKGKHKFRSGVYGHPDVRAALDGLYHDKCAFCETNSAAGATPQVEHYRPKAGVKGTPHDGYYWLAYQWSNLLLACPSCNINKTTHFPLDAAGTRLTAAPLSGTSLDMARCLVTYADLVNEQPLLVNPETDPDPRRHFASQPDGTVTGLTLAGQTTIDLLKLNRPPLVEARQKVLNRCLINMEKAIREWGKQRLTSAELQGAILISLFDLIGIARETEAYSEFALTCWRQFPQFVLAWFPDPPAQAEINRVYQRVLLVQQSV